mmetsp:Transcript_35540/g.74635  ORF Transcript_35540/g.74635 Transcript_35540/m.74635 type:complete len:84 (+) Transcript_35540:921-1172(+)
MKGQWLLVTPRGAKEVKCVEKEVGALDATWADGSAKWLGMATELLQLGWMPFGEFKFRMLRAASLSSQECDIVNVSSSDSMGE